MVPVTIQAPPATFVVKPVVTSAFRGTKWVWCTWQFPGTSRLGPHPSPNPCRLPGRQWGAAPVEVP